nr:lysocardiolipin acyltransferase 1-like [Lytechinus pictus]
MNHRTRLDWLFFIACLLRHTQPSNLKIILKNQLKSSPCLGWAMQVACFIFLARQWAKDCVWLTSVLKYFSEMRYDFQLLLFPEGINFCRTGQEISNAYAQKHDLPRYKYVLHPHTTGFSFTVDYLRQTKMIDTVYDVTVAYCDTVPEKGEIDIFRGNVPKEMQFLIHKYPVSALPQNKEDLDNWCVEKWKEKEHRLEKFYTGNKTFEGQEDGKLENLSSQSVWKVYFIIACWVYGVLFSAYLLLTSSFVLWGSVVIMTAYVVIGKYFGGVDNISIASFNFTQDLTHKARTT